MSNKMLYVLALIYLSAMSFAQRPDPFKGAQPVAVLVQTNPWLMVIGSDTPRVVIYDDGEVVYSQADEHQTVHYVHAQLKTGEMETVKKKLASFGDYALVKRQYNLAPNVTDLPETMIYLNLDGRLTVTSIYGLMVSGTRLPAYTQFPGAKGPDSMPEVLRSLYTYLAELKFADVKPWMPKYIEVMVWPYSYAPDKSIHWPKDWPGLESPEAFQRGDSYSIFLPASETQRLADFLKTRKEKGAVEVGGKKWAVAFRYAFPSEPIWMRAFRSS